MNILHLFVALAELALAFALFTQTLNARAVDGNRCAWRMWALAMAVGLFGVGRFTSFLEGSDGPLIYTFAHICLIGYATKRYLRSRRVHGAKAVTT